MQTLCLIHVCCLCFPVIFLMVSGKNKDFFILMKSNFQFFYFMGHAFGTVFKEPLPIPRLQRFSLFFAFRNFRVLGFTWSFMIHFEVILIYGWMSIFVHMVIQLFQHHLLETSLSSTELLWHLCWKPVVCTDLFLDSILLELTPANKNLLSSVLSSLLFGSW